MEEKEAILLTILGETAQKIYDNMTFIKTEANDKANDIFVVLNKFQDYIEPQINTIFERCYRRNHQEYETLNSNRKIQIKQTFEDTVVKHMSSRKNYVRNLGKIVQN